MLCNSYIWWTLIFNGCMMSQNIVHIHTMCVCVCVQTVDIRCFANFSDHIFMLSVSEKLILPQAEDGSSPSCYQLVLNLVLNQPVSSEVCTWGQFRMRLLRVKTGVHVHVCNVALLWCNLEWILIQERQGRASCVPPSPSTAAPDPCKLGRHWIPVLYMCISCPSPRHTHTHHPQKFLYCFFHHMKLL